MHENMRSLGSLYGHRSHLLLKIPFDKVGEAKCSILKFITDIHTHKGFHDKKEMITLSLLCYVILSCFHSANSDFITECEFEGGERLHGSVIVPVSCPG